MFLALRNGERVRPEPKQQALCPGCERVVGAKCGPIVVWHWAHRASEMCHWNEGEGQWHLQWKERFHADGAEVEARRTIDGVTHVADVITQDGRIIELQASSISLDTATERQRFWGKRMQWLLKADDWIPRIKFKRGPRSEIFYWKQPRNTIVELGGVLYWDTGNEVWVVACRRKEHPDFGSYVEGKRLAIITYAEFIKGAGKLVVSPLMMAAARAFNPPVPDNNLPKCRKCGTDDVTLMGPIIGTGHNRFPPLICCPCAGLVRVA